MARYSGKNTDSKSLRGAGGAASITLTPEQQAEVDFINDEIKIIKQEIDRISRRKGQIENILDNFEQVAVGSLLVDILPDEDSDEIKNSKIISKAEILEKLKIDAEEQTSGSNARQNRSANIIDKIFKLDIIQELISQSSELNEDEMYIIVLRDAIYDVEADGANPNQNRRAREKLEDIFDDLENDD